MQNSGLTTHKLANSVSDISDDFAIESDDLTEVGYVVMCKGYDTWLSKVDAGMDLNDISILARFW